MNNPIVTPRPENLMDSRLLQENPLQEQYCQPEVNGFALTAESVLKARGQSVKTENGLEQGALLYIP